MRIQPGRRLTFVEESCPASEIIVKEEEKDEQRYGGRGNQFVFWLLFSWGSKK